MSSSNVSEYFECVNLEIEGELFARPSNAEVAVAMAESQGSEYFDWLDLERGGELLAVEDDEIELIQAAPLAGTEENLTRNVTVAEATGHGMIIPFQPLTMTFLNVSYFVDMPKGINGISPIPNGYNPATWILEVTTLAVEERIRMEFSELYKNSEQYREVEATIMQMSVPVAGSEPLKFSTTYSQNFLAQIIICLQKYNLVYLRTPSYGLMRLIFGITIAFLLSSVFWHLGSKRASVNGKCWLLVVISMVHN
ncbi:ABC transporter G family member 31-like [Tripterygium wilfordii]|uniref:ABC transporter G family member 31-like n=1 Tax=Tripterygium wilfordii TaxID=458696 RepID=A0A7J7DDQ2_TRIWF|nr:ABC transporter G family member 31-like [Tripterygium wilfordii]